MRKLAQSNIQSVFKFAFASFLVVSASVQLAMAQTPASASKVPTDAEVDKIMEERYCSGCHDMAKKMVGPSFNDVTKKYAEGDKKVNAEKLSIAISKGGKGVWGATPMPANAAVTADELKTITNWLVNRTVK
jgi:cytochrome c